MGDGGDSWRGDFSLVGCVTTSSSRVYVINRSRKIHSTNGRKSLLGGTGTPQDDFQSFSRFRAQREFQRESPKWHSTFSASSQYSLPLAAHLLQLVRQLLAS